MLLTATDFNTRKTFISYSGGFNNIYNTNTIYTKFINKYGSYLLISDWAGLKWCPVWEELQDKHSEEAKNSYK